jgi:hypothetical protein
LKASISINSKPGGCAFLLRANDVNEFTSAIRVAADASRRVPKADQQIRNVERAFIHPQGTFLQESSFSSFHKFFREYLEIAADILKQFGNKARNGMCEELSILRICWR